MNGCEVENMAVLSLVSILRNLMKRLLCTIAAFLTLFSVAVADASKTSDEAIAAFRVLWKESLAKKLETGRYGTLLKYLVFERGRVWAHSESSEAKHNYLTKLLSAEDKKRVILVGNLDDLKPDRQVWSITNPGGDTNGFEAYLDQKDGRLILLWIREEG